MSNIAKRRSKIIKMLSDGEIYSVAEIHKRTGIAKVTVSNDVYDMIANRKIERITLDNRTGYKLL